MAQRKVINLKASRILFLHLFVVAIILIVVNIILYKRFNTDTYIMIARESASWTHVPEPCLSRKLWAKCEILTNEQKLLVIGDSHAQQLMLVREIVNSRKPILISSEIMRFDWLNVTPDTDQHLQEIKQLISELENDDEILFAFTTGHLKAKFKSEIRKKIEKFSSIISYILEDKKKDITVSFLLDNPVLKLDVSHICQNHRNKNKSICLLNREEYLTQNDLLLKGYQLGVNKANIKDVSIIDPTDYFCGDKYCNLYRQDEFILIDDNHLSEKFMQEYYHEFLKVKKVF